MKKVVLLGDSIRMGYDKYVKAALEGVAEVYYPSVNCKFTQNVLRMIGSWKKEGEWGDDVDLVHWNVGLWDLLHLDEAALSTPEYYGYMIGRIDRKLRELFPNAKMIFAYSTSVNESGNGPGHGRYNAEIEQYNAIAAENLEEGTLINDLYTISKLAAERGAMSDRTHYATDEGRRLLGGQVIRMICEELEITAGEVDLEKFKPENYSVEEIGF